jgi:LAS superfamily LD-carboxypeptidase LdcB
VNVKSFMWILIASVGFSQMMYVFVDVLNVRACPSLECRVVDKLYFREEVQVYEMKESEKGYSWAKTEFGWVALQFLDTLPLKIRKDPACINLNESSKPLPDDYYPDDLISLPNEISIKKGIKLRKEAFEALMKMINAAKEDGITLKVASAFRDWFYQRVLYKEAIERYGPNQKWVAKPGRSEHQLGTTVDLVGEDMSLALKKDFKYSKEYRWLLENAGKFGFIQSYGQENPYYEEEPWHFRFVGNCQNFSVDLH